VARSQYSILLCFLVFIRCGTVSLTYAAYFFRCLSQIRQNKQEGYSKWIFYLVDSWLWSRWAFLQNLCCILIQLQLCQWISFLCYVILVNEYTTQQGKLSLFPPLYFSYPKCKLGFNPRFLRMAPSDFLGKLVGTLV